MSEWIEAELAACQMHEARHTKRLARLVGRLSERPVSSSPRACHGWAETVAADRFLENPDIGWQESLSGHKHATRERIRAQELVLLVQDATFLHDGTTQPTAGMGTVTIKGRDESLLQPTVALIPERVKLGVLGARWGQRPEPPVGRARTRKPLEATERDRGLAGEALACAVQQACPQTLVVKVADRDGAMHEWFLEAQRRPAGERAAWLLRAKCHRRSTKGPTPSDLWAELHGTRALGTMTVEVARTPDRAPRQVTGAVAVQRVTFEQARRLGGKLPPVAVTAV